MTIEQINAEITAKPELKTALLGSLKNDMLEGMKAEGLIIRNKDEEAQFLTNYETNIIPVKVQAEIGTKIKAVHDQYDNDLFEILGERKAGTEKTYDFMKRKLAELKKKGSKDDDPVLADQVKDLTAKIKQYENYVAPDEVEKIKTKYFTDSLQHRLSSTLDKFPIAIPAHITDDKAKQEYTETQKRFIKSDFLNRFTAKQDDKGNVVYYDGDKLLTDAKTAAPLTEDQLIRGSYSGYFIPEKKAQGGTGSGQGSEGGKQPDANEASLKTKAEVMAHLKAKGMAPGAADFTKEYSRIIKEYAITEPGE